MNIDYEAVKREFLAEAEEQLSTLEQGLVALEERPNDAKVLEALFRMAHTFKGGAKVVGLNTVVAFAHLMEDLLERLREGTLPASHELTTLLLSCVDALRAMLPEALAGKEELPPAYGNLRKWLEQHGIAPSAPMVSQGEGQREGEGASGEMVDGGMEKARSLRVNVSKLDRMLNLTGELVIAFGRLSALWEQLEASEDIRESQHETGRLLQELQEQVMQVRMVPLGPTFRQHIRAVRDLAMSQGKDVRLVVEGADVEVDTGLLEHVKDPITHMIRNSVDHGIETPAVRKSKGKDPVGRITVSAQHQGGYVLVIVKDDGAGLNRQKIAERARARLGWANAEHMPDEELFKALFEAGFSTADQVTELSGRGVGMHVVRKNVEALRGTVEISSEEGKGSTVVLKLPLTLAIIDGFAVGSDNETYIIPLDAVRECIELPEQSTEGAKGVLNLRGEALPYLSLRKMFGLGGKPDAKQSIVVVRHESGEAGLVVDRLFGEQQTVIKPLGKVFQSLPGVSGSAILGSGQVALILDVPGLVREALKQESKPVSRQAGH